LNRRGGMKDFELQDELQALQLGTTEIEHDHDFTSEDPERLLEGQ
jgi:condensin complex subunit 1